LGAPLHWQVGRTPRNVRWQAQLGSLSFASPVVAGGLVWVGTNNDRPRDPKVTGDAAVLMCFRRRDGKFLWQYASPRLRSEDEDYPRSSLNNSPLVEADRLYFITNRGEVLCFDIGPLLAETGTPRQRWKLDLRKELGVRLRAPAMSIGLSCSIGPSYRGRLFVSTNNGRAFDGKMPAPAAAALVCLDRDTGKVLWSDNSPGKDVLCGQGSSPLLAEAAGRAQVVAAQGDGWLRSFDPLTGRLLWKFDCNPKKATPYRLGGGGEKCFFTATPVLYEGRVYVGVGQEVTDGPGVGHLWCIDLVKATARGKTNKDKDVSPRNDNFDPNAPVNKDSALAWHFGGKLARPTDEGPEFVFGRTMSNVVVHDGLVIAPELAGYVHCLDARTGRPYWVHDALEVIIGSPLIADGKVYVPTEGGVTVLALGRTHRVLARNEAGYPCVGPVFAHGTLYLADHGRLYAIAAGEGDRPWGHWPQWRGPARDNVADEKGLLVRWPKDGPPLAWQVSGLGDGPGTVAVAGGRVYALGRRGTEECLSALDEATGKPAWSVALGPAVNEREPMRWLSPRTPVAAGELLYAATARGDLVCVGTDGTVKWRKNYRTDFAGRSGVWGYCDQPLVDGDQLICVPGGRTATVVALDRQTGALKWKCPLGDEPAQHGATVLSTAGGVRHYVVVLANGLVGISPAGKVLWRYTGFARWLPNCYAAMPHGNQVLAVGGYGRGAALLELTPGKGELRVEQRYRLNLALPPWHEPTVRLGDHLYLGTARQLLCLEVKTGKVVWEEKTGVGNQAALTCAAGHLYVRTVAGKVSLIEASPKGFVARGTLQVPGAVPRAGASAPVVAGGRLYLRDDDRLFCFDVYQGGKPGKPGRFTVPAVKAAGGPARPGVRREPDAIFVPTPQDVVEKMLELARVKKSETVADLGCGDGRIVVTAARKYGCKAIGYDIDPECVKLARENVGKHRVGALVSIVQKDFFTVELEKIDVVALYLPPRVCGRLLPQLQRLRPGARIVAHAFALPGIVADRALRVPSKEDGVEHKVFLYTAPLKKAKEPPGAERR
jgi:outer membrane protein assembly factor BamB/precorrin-6B methylase 2